MNITLADIQDARQRIRPEIVATPFEYSRTLSLQTGAAVYLKFENQQFTASF